MINKKYLKLIRSYQRYDKNNFIYEIISKRIIDSLDLLNIDANQVLEIGINDNLIYDYLNKKFLNSKIDRSDVCPTKFIDDKDDLNFIEINIDNLNFKNNFYDIIYSNSFLHLTNNFEFTLESILSALKPNGFFVAAIPDKSNMFQLFNCMYETDLKFYDGVFQRVNPTLNVDNILPIFKKLQFDSPSIYADNITIEYKKFNKLINDIKNMNLSYSHIDKRKNFENKKYFYVLENLYKKNYFNESFLLDIKVNIISAWKK